ncbi:MAG: hypothetical protein EBV19_06925, partial [Flavobacteriia bacterium]|nr:hypothetical protein [Flavobacteriia bacterium]
MPSSQSVVILAAGEGKRMGPGCSKVLRKLNGKPMIERIINAVIRLKNIEDIFVIANEKNYNDIVLLAPGCKVLLQGAERGTAKAVEPWSLYDDDPEEMALIISGDTPLLTTSMLQRFLDESATTGIVVFTPDDPKQYGRVILQNSKVSIKEFSDCNDEERQNRLCNAGIYNISRGLFKKYMKEINNHNVQHEYYLPDVINNMTEDVF